MGRTLALVLVCLSSATAQRYEKLAPFDGLRWNGDVPEVQVGSTWYELVSIDGTSQAEILASCKKTWRRVWRKRFNEDLVEVLSRMGSPPGTTVDLGVRYLSGGAVKTLKGVAMTAERRQALHAQRRATTAGRPALPEEVTRADLNQALDRLDVLR